MILIPEHLIKPIIEWAKENNLAVQAVGSNDIFVAIIGQRDDHPNYTATVAASLCLEGILSNSFMQNIVGIDSEINEPKEEIKH